MKFCIEVDLDKLTDDPAEELSRALRYWAGNLKYYSLDKPHHESIRDSSYEEVDSWSLS